MSPQTHYGALAGPMRSDIDEIATMTGLDYTPNVLLDTRGRVINIIGGSHPQAHRHAIEQFNSIYAYENPVTDSGQADIVVCGVFAPTDHLFFHTGWGCMSTDIVLKDGVAPGADTTKRLQDHVKATIAPFKYPRSIKFIDSLPKTQTGKIQSFRLRPDAS